MSAKPILIREYRDEDIVIKSFTTNEDRVQTDQKVITDLKKLFADIKKNLE